MKKSNDQPNLIIYIFTAVALLAIVGGGYTYFTNTSEPNEAQHPDTSNTLATDESSTIIEHKVMKPPIPSDGEENVADEEKVEPKAGDESGETDKAATEGIPPKDDQKPESAGDESADTEK